jgi:acetyl esterase/lipase
MRRLIIAALVAALPAPALAQDFRIEPIAAPSQAKAIPLYPDQPKAAPGDAEQWSHMHGKLGEMVIDNQMVRNVTRPTITPYLPAPGKGTGAAVVVAPGGAFLSLSMTSEGETIARWLADHGVAAFVLKYRLNATPRDDKAFMAFMGSRMSEAATSDHVPDIKEPRATQDALRALELIRARAKDFSVDPARLGMIGFSAGAMTTLRAALEGSPDQRPAFIGYIYGPMEAIAVPADAPPMFNAIAMDDGLFARQGFGIVEAWRKAKRPVELHAYERGDHGFGAGHPGTTTTGVLPQFLAWMEARGLLSARKQ